MTRQFFILFLPCMYVRVMCWVCVCIRLVGGVLCSVCLYFTVYYLVVRYVGPSSTVAAGRAALEEAVPGVGHLQLLQQSPSRVSRQLVTTVMALLCYGDFCVQRSGGGGGGCMCRGGGHYGASG